MIPFPPPPTFLFFYNFPSSLFPAPDPGTNPTTEINAPNSFRVQAKLRKEECNG